MEKDKSLSELIRYYRVYVKHMTQDEFGKYTGYATRTIQSWELGEKIPGIRSLRDILDDEDLLTKALLLRDELQCAKLKPSNNIEIIDAIDVEKEPIKKSLPQLLSYHSKIKHLNATNGFKDYRKTCGFDKDYNPNIYASKVIGKNTYYPIKGGANVFSHSLVIGGPGSGKNFHYIEPNLKHNNGKNFLMFGYGEVNELQELLPDYDITCFDTTDFNRSCSYNPFEYIEDRKDLIIAINAFYNAHIDRTNNTETDPFYSIAKKNFLYALFEYVKEMYPKEDQNLNILYEMFSAAKCYENHQEYFDTIFKELENKDSTSIAVSFYRTYKKSSPKTSLSIIISASVMFWSMDIPNIKEKISTDELCLNELYTKKNKMVYVKMSPVDNSFDFFAAMILAQFQYSTVKEKRLKGIFNNDDIWVEVILNEFYNIRFDIDILVQALPVARKYNVSYDIIIQSINQLNAICDEHAEYIIGCCDIIIFQQTMDINNLEQLKSIIQWQKINQYEKLYTDVLTDNKNYDKQVVCIRTATPMIVEKP